MFGLKACSAAVISHHPVPSGCFRLTRERYDNSGAGLVSPSAANRKKRKKRTGTKNFKGHVKVVGFIISSKPFEAAGAVYLFILLQLQKCFAITRVTMWAHIKPDGLTIWL